MAPQPDSEPPRVLQLFEAARKHGRPLHVSAPMVRYSKLPFRLLVREYKVDVVYTPMMLAHEFVRSQVARDSDFTTNALERQSTADGNEHALIAQFASSDPTEFARAAEMVAPWVDGVDLNCGCPQSWALKEGIGCSLMASPELVASMVRAAKARLDPSKTVSVKIRIHKDLALTLGWAKAVEPAGVDFITVHGRTRGQRSSTSPDYNAIRTIKEHASVPIVANGDAYSLADISEIATATKVDGVMMARGILENPAMAAGFQVTPVECVKRFLELAVRCPIPFPLVLHHISEMTGKTRSVTREEKRKMMACQDVLDLVDFIEDKWGLNTSSTGRLEDNT